MLSSHHSRFIMVMTVFWLVLSPCVSSSFSSLVSNLKPEGQFAPAAPSISSPSDMTYENGTVNKKIVWNSTDPSPKNYTVTRNGTIHKSGSWSGGAIEVLLNHLYTEKLVSTLPALFVFVCKVFNTSNESVSDEVLVTLIADTTSPIISAPANFSYEEGSFGHTVTWNITESNPDFYNVTRTSNETTSNRTVVKSGQFYGANISINVDGLNATHWYVYTLFVNDTLKHNATSSVNVTVYLDVTPPTVTQPDDLTFEFGSRGHKIVWHVYDSNPKNYTVRVTTLYTNSSYGNVSAFHSPTNITMASWTFIDPEGNDVTTSLDSIFLGNYTFTILLFDKYGRNNTDSLNVTIYKDIRAPVVTGKAYLGYEEGYKGNYLNWSADESNPRSYNLTRDGAVLMNGTWRGENLSVNVDRLSVGIHVYNMTLTDFFNQSAVTVTTVNVTADAHIPTVSGFAVIQSFTTGYANNLTVQVYCWDINNISSIRVEWGLDTNHTVNATMQSQGRDLYSASLGEYAVGSIVVYRVIAVDNSSMKNVHTTPWMTVVVTSMLQEESPGYLWGLLLALGLLSSLIIAMLYFRTKSR